MKIQKLISLIVVFVCAGFFYFYQNKNAASNIQYGIVEDAQSNSSGSVVSGSNNNLTKTLPKYYQVKSIDFIDSSGMEISLDSLRNKPILIHFFFASCKGVCPNIIGKMKSLYEKYGNKVNFVSVTIDSKKDNLGILQEYKNKVLKNISTTNSPNSLASWSFVKLKNKKLLKKFMEEDLKLPFNKIVESHTTKVVLLDEELFTRAFFDGMDLGFVEEGERKVGEFVG